MIRDQLADSIRDALETLGVDPVPTTVSVERPARREHGDWSTNVALASAKAAGRNPRALAADLVAALETNPPTHVNSVELAGPGFVNFRLADTWLHDVLRKVVTEGTDDYARLTLGQRDDGGALRVNVEFISANPNKPIHAGHGRGACYGDAVARLLERCGYQVTREYLLNDRGTQMTKFAESLAARVAGETPPDDGYHGEYVREWAAEMPPEADPLEWGYARALQSHKATAERLRIDFDVWFSERSMVANGEIDQTLRDLRDRGAVFDADGAVWLRATDYGDTKDRVLVKRDGDYTYVLPDIAYHRDKFRRGFDLLIDVWGADHHGYIPRMRAAIEALGHDASTLEVPIVQMVDLVRKGEEVKISGRAGTALDIDDVIDIVGVDAARFTYLMQSVDSRLVFDFDLVASQAMENPVYYVQYAHARIHSLMAKAAVAGVIRRDLDAVDLGRLATERELDVLRVLFELPEVVRLACQERAPHKVSGWVRELAGAFHGFYHDCRVVGDEVDEATTQARLWLIEAARVGLVVGLGLLGVSTPEAM